MKQVISASRRTDLVAFFPEWLSEAIGAEKAAVAGPTGHVYTVDLRPDSVHTLVLWSKDFHNLIANRCRLRERVKRYAQVYFHFTVTGLGGGPVEPHVPPPDAALRQLPELLEIAGRPQRISVRFDPVVYWKEGNTLLTNLPFFETVAETADRLGITEIRFSLAQWYGKSKRRAAKHRFPYVDPPPEDKKKAALNLSDIARARGLNLYSCSQDFLTEVPGIRPSACIDGRLLQECHPLGENVSIIKDRTQRKECRCTESADIGSYIQSCPHSCLYCYANPKL
jgi:hypothetical protein